MKPTGGFVKNPSLIIGSNYNNDLVIPKHYADKIKNCITTDDLTGNVTINININEPSAEEIKEAMETLLERMRNNNETL